MLSKWMFLQESIKEKITLNEIIIKHKQNNLQDLLSFYKEYYSEYIKIKQSLDFNKQVVTLDKSKLENYKYVLADNPDMIFNESYQPLYNLLFQLRQNPIILKEVLLYSGFEQLSQISDFVFFQMFENIHINNPEGEESLILITLLLVDEINKLKTICSNSFLEGNLISKFLSSLYKRDDIKQFIHQWVSELIIKLEYSKDDFLSITPEEIDDYIIENNINNLGVNEKETRQRSLYQSVVFNKNEGNGLNHLSLSMKNVLANVNKKKSHHSNFFHKFKKKMAQLMKLKKEQEKIKDSSQSSNNLPSVIMNGVINSSKVNYKQEVNGVNDDDDEDDEDDVNDEYDSEKYNETDEDEDKSIYSSLPNNPTALASSCDMTSTSIFLSLLNLVNSQNNQEIRNYYLNKLNYSINNNNTFTVFYTQNYLIKKYEHEKRKVIIDIFNSNNDKVKSFVDDLLATLNAKLNFLPYFVKCLCKIIFDLVKIKFPSANTIEYNQFIGKFLFCGLLLPLLVNPDYHAIIRNCVISLKTRQKLLIFSKVIKNISLYGLFSINDMFFTSLNPYIIEMGSIMNNLYESIIDLPYTNFLEEQFKEISNKNNKIHIERIVKYDYFKQMPSQLIQLNTILFSVGDVLLLMDIIKKINDLKTNPIFKPIVKSYEKLTYQREFFISMMRNDYKNLSIRHFLLSSHDYNSEVACLFNTQQLVFTCSDYDDEKENKKAYFLSRIKFCIKYIFEKLNLINEKAYSYLNKIKTSGDFFLALYEIILLQDQSLQIENIPLSWYSIYLNSNINKLDKSYIDNNYELLYEELLSEEQDQINLIQKNTNYIITKLGLNLRCAEKRVESIIRNRVNTKIEEKQIRVEKFIVQCQIPICVRFNTKSGDNCGLTISDPMNCIHTQIKNLDKMVDGSKGPVYEFLKFTNIVKQSDRAMRSQLDNDINEHGKSIFDFVKLLSKITEVQKAVQSGSNSIKIYDVIAYYLGLLNDELYKDKLFDNFIQQDINECLERLESYLFNKLYKHLYPTDPTQKDTEFLIKCIKLNWVTPELLGINKKYINEHLWLIASDFLKEIESEKTPLEKLNSFQKAFNVLNKCIIFCSGKKEGAGLDDIAPILYYIIIKLKPKRYHSNFNYIKALIDPSKLKTNYGFILTQIEISLEYIVSIDNKAFNMDEIDYKIKCDKSINDHKKNR